MIILGQWFFLSSHQASFVQQHLYELTFSGQSYEIKLKRLRDGGETEEQLLKVVYCWCIIFAEIHSGKFI
jgi:hypothetical protein